MRASRSPLAQWSVVVAAAVGCSRSKVEAVDAAPSASAAPIASIAPAPSRPRDLPLFAVDAGSARPGPPPPTYGEAPRTRVTRAEAEPRLAPHAEILREHFGGALPALELQDATLSGGRHALLVHRESGDLDPIVLVVDGGGRISWSKPRPVAGIVAPVTHVAIMAGPEGRVSLALCDPPTQSLAIRHWDHDGTPFADMHLLHVDACDALSAMYWPKNGWLVVASSAAGARGQLLAEDGAIAWGANGVPLGTAWRAAAAPTLVADTDTSFVYVQHALAGTSGPDHVLAFRYDTRGVSLFDKPADLGAVGHVEPASKRIEAARVRDGAVRVTVNGRAIEVGTKGTR